MISKRKMQVPPFVQFHDIAMSLFLWVRFLFHVCWVKYVFRLVSKTNASQGSLFEGGSQCITFGTESLAEGLTFVCDVFT